MKNTITLLVFGMIIFFTSCGGGSGDESVLNLKTPEDAINFIIKINNLDSEEILKYNKSSWSSGSSFWTDEEQDLQYSCNKSDNPSGCNGPGYMYYGNIGNNKKNFSSGKTTSLEWELSFDENNNLCYATIKYRDIPFTKGGPSGEFTKVYTYHYKGKSGYEYYDWGGNILGTVQNDTVDFGKYLNNKMEKRIGTYFSGRLKDKNGHKILGHYKINEHRNENGDFDGEQTYYDEYNYLIEKIIYDNGKKMSHIKYHKHSTLLLYELPLKDGVMDGVSDFYLKTQTKDNQTGKYVWKIYLSESTTYKEGVKNGKYTKFYKPAAWIEVDPNVKIVPSQKEVEGYYTGKDKTGEWKKYYETGEIVQVEIYVDGKRQKGTSIRYDTDGNITRKW